jgi:hypothetical protein
MMLEFILQEMSVRSSCHISLIEIWTTKMMAYCSMPYIYKESVMNLFALPYMECHQEYEFLVVVIPSSLKLSLILEHNKIYNPWLSFQLCAEL